VKTFQFEEIDRFTYLVTLFTKKLNTAEENRKFKLGKKLEVWEKKVLGKIDKEERR
jgi:hypothetical protein